VDPLSTSPARGGRPLFDRRLLLTAPFTLLLAPPAGAQGLGVRPRLDVPYLPTPQPVVDRMLELAQVGANDLLYDLGCGDGRIVITAARDRGARGVGIDIDPERIAEARENAQKEGVADRVAFRVGDLFESEFGEATVVTLYLLPDINRRLRPQLWRQLQVGTRVVSHAFDMGEEWPPEHTELVNYRTLHAWTIRPEHKKRR
jgi:SAM-dependent methyltransferase